MDILKQEIEKKKRRIEEKAGIEPEKKYYRRGELQKKETEEYLKKRFKLDADAALHLSGGPTDESSQDSSSADQGDGEKKIPLSRKEVIRRLRERSEPIRLFSENDYEAFQRLKKLEMLEPEINKGFQNDFQDAMEKVDQEFLKELLKSTGSDHGSTDVNVRDDGTTYEEIMKLGERLGQGDEALDYQVLLKFLKHVLNMSPHVMRRSSPTPSPPPRSRRISPPQNRSSLPRRRSPSPRMSRNARAPSISPPPVARVMSRKSRSRSPSLLRLSHQSSLQGSKLSGDRRQFAMERSPSLRSPPPMPLHARYSPIDKPRRGLPPAKSDAPLYRSPSVSPPRQNSPIFRKGVGPESHRRSPRPMSPSLLARRRTRRSPSSSPGRKPAFSPKRRSQDWSPPPRAYQLGTAMKGHAMVDSWGDGNQRYSPKRKGAPSPPPSSPPQHRHRHKSKKLKA